LAQGRVSALAVDDQDGAVFVGGAFESIGGASRYRLAKLDGSGTGSADPDWSPTTLGDNHVSVNAITLDNGRRSIYVGGFFERIGNQERLGLAKLYSDAETIFINGFN
jgi:hypothetical protein